MIVSTQEVVEIVRAELEERMEVINGLRYEAHRLSCKVTSCKTILFSQFHESEWGVTMPEVFRHLRDALFATAADFHAEYTAWKAHQEDES